MIEHLSPERDANAIRMQRTTFPGTFLLVEGSSDKTFYERFVDKEACKLISISGKPSSKLLIIKVLSILENSNFQGVLAIIDADFDHLNTPCHISPNLIYSITVVDRLD